MQWKTSHGRFGLCVNTAGKDAIFNEIGGGGRSPAEGKHPQDQRLIRRVVTWRFEW